MIANIYIPLWPFGVVFIALCFLPDVPRWISQARAAVREAARPGRTSALPGVRPYDQMDGDAA